MKLDSLPTEARKWADKVLNAHKELTESGRVLVIEAARERATIAAAEDALQREGYLIEGLIDRRFRNASARMVEARELLSVDVLDSRDESDGTIRSSRTRAGRTDRLGREALRPRSCSLRHASDWAWQSGVSRAARGAERALHFER